jgi:hypothetical protein
VKIEKLRNSLDFIECLEGACKANSQLSPQDNERLWNPPRELLDTSNPALRHAVKTFMGADTPVTVEAFNAVRDAALEWHPNDFFPSFYQTQKTLAEWSGINAIECDMCPNSCIAYTGPFADLEKCPYKDCSKPNKLCHGIRQASAKFWTIPIGPFLQSLCRNPKTAKEMKYWREWDKKIWERSTITPEQWEDIFDGSDYVKLVRDGTIKPTDMVLIFSIDGAQLYAHKSSDC